MPKTASRIAAIFREHRDSMLTAWIAELKSSLTARLDLLRQGELGDQCSRLLDLIQQALATDATIQIKGAAWDEVRDFLDVISRSRALQGISPTDTALFVFSLKKPLFDRIGAQKQEDGAVAQADIWQANLLIDRLGLFTAESYLHAREDVIARQQVELLELSTPVVKLWDGILALPLIGTLDSARTQVVMESLLQKIVDSGSEIAIIDITGVPTVDTLVAQHLLKTVTAARLMGAECIISGIRPQIAQTIVHLGVDLAGIITKASLSDAFVTALRRLGLDPTLIKKLPRAGDFI